MNNINRYINLAKEIDKEYSKLCMATENCKECKYDISSHCKSLFTIEYLKNMEHKNGN